MRQGWFIVLAWCDLPAEDTLRQRSVRARARTCCAACSPQGPTGKNELTISSAGGRLYNCSRWNSDASTMKERGTPTPHSSTLNQMIDSAASAPSGGGCAVCRQGQVAGHPMHTKQQVSTRAPGEASRAMMPPLPAATTHGMIGKSKTPVN